VLLERYVYSRGLLSVSLWQIDGSSGLFSYVSDPLVTADPFGLVRLFTSQGVEVDAYAGPLAGGKEHSPLHVHVREGNIETRVLMENYHKKGKLVAARGSVYPGDREMTRKMRRVLMPNIDELSEKAKSVFERGGCG
jgi:hypothetical protein